MPQKIAFYTVIIGQYDHLKAPMYFEKLVQHVDFYCLTDQKDLKSSVYSVLQLNLDENISNPTKKSRFPKINSHLFFPNYEYTVYLDANQLLVADNLIFVIENYLGSYDLARFGHMRNCIYQEAEACKRHSLDQGEIIDQQMARYKSEGFPEEFGLGSNNMLIRKNNAVVQDFNEKWWDEYKENSQRDQLSFDYIRWNSDIKVNIIPMKWDNNSICYRFEHNIKRPTPIEISSVVNKSTIEFFKERVKYLLLFLLPPISVAVLKTFKKLTRGFY